MKNKILFDEKNELGDFCGAKDRDANTLSQSEKPLSDYLLILKSSSLLLRSIWGVMTSPSMPDYKTYRNGINSIDFSDFFQPKSFALVSQINEALSNSKMKKISFVHSIDIFSTLICFIDDHSEDYPPFCFDKSAIINLVEWIKKSKIPLTVPEIVKSEILNSTIFTIDKLLIVHATLRLIARGRDFRAFSNFTLSLEERIQISKNIAPFEINVSNGGDPLGDSYHYVANIIIGITFSNKSFFNKIPIVLFMLGPYLMKIIREYIFGNILFFGNHCRIDHMGLNHGLKISEHIKRRDYA